MSRQDFQIELAESRVAAERDATVNRIQAGLRSHGCADCADCGEPIEAERRRAMPSAIRCVRCQGQHEKTRTRCLTS